MEPLKTTLPKYFFVDNNAILEVSIKWESTKVATFVAEIPFVRIWPCCYASWRHDNVVTKKERAWDRGCDN